MTDLELVRECRSSRNERAFEEIVQRYSGLVYASALRRVDQDHALAQDVTQSVFIILHRKLETFKEEVPLVGWLLKTTSFVARRALSAKFRRHRLEMEMLNQAQWSTSSETDARTEADVPFLDDAFLTLKPQEQRCISERFFREASFKEIADSEQISEDAAQKRVSRALDKLKSYLVRRGVGVSGVAAIAVGLSATAKASTPAMCSGILSAVAAAETGGEISAAVVLAKISLAAMVRQQIFLFTVQMCVGLAVLTPVGWAAYAKFRPLRGNANGTTALTSPPLAPSIPGLAKQWSSVVRNAAVLVAAPRYPTNTPSGALQERQLQAMYAEAGRIMGDLNGVLSPTDAKPQLTEFLTLELSENLQLNANQQSSVSNLVVSALARARWSDAQSCFAAVVREKPRLIPQIQNLLTTDQKQLFSGIYRADGVGLFTVATLSVQSAEQEQKK